jgi:hypothetical protein
MCAGTGTVNELLADVQQLFGSIGARRKTQNTTQYPLLRQFSCPLSLHWPRPVGASEASGAEPR